MFAFIFYTFGGWVILLTVKLTIIPHFSQLDKETNLNSSELYLIEYKPPSVYGHVMYNVDIKTDLLLKTSHLLFKVDFLSSASRYQDRTR